MYVKVKKQVTTGLKRQFSWKDELWLCLAVSQFYNSNLWPKLMWMWVNAMYGKDMVPTVFMEWIEWPLPPIRLCKIMAVVTHTHTHRCKTKPRELNACKSLPHKPTSLTRHSFMVMHDPHTWYIPPHHNPFHLVTRIQITPGYGRQLYILFNPLSTIHWIWIWILDPLIIHHYLFIYFSLKLVPSTFLLNWNRTYNNGK